METRRPAKASKGPLTLIDVCAQFRSDPSHNPRTGKKITRGGPTYKKLVNECKDITSIPAGISGPEVHANIPGPEIQANIPGPEIHANIPGSEVHANIPGPEVHANIPGSKVHVDILCEVAKFLSENDDPDYINLVAIGGVKLLGCRPLLENHFLHAVRAGDKKILTAIMEKEAMRHHWMDAAVRIVVESEDRDLLHFLIDKSAGMDDDQRYVITENAMRAAVEKKIVKYDKSFYCHGYRRNTISIFEPERC